MISFLKIPYHYKTIKNQIKKQVIRNIYSKFSFLYYPFFNGFDDDENINNQHLIDYLINYLQDFKFITYQLNTSDNNQKVNTIICIESKCLIIEEIDLVLINDIITKLKNLNIIILNTNEYQNNKLTDEEQLLIDQINKFCQCCMEEINKNWFCQITLFPLIGYLIQRFSYPTSYFKDPSFFTFGHSFRSKECELKTKFTNFFESKNTINEIKQSLTNVDNELDIHNFKEEDLIELKTISSKVGAIFKKVIHKESLHIFILKKLTLSDDSKRFVQHETEFCQNYSHRCMTHFYGFLKEKNRFEIVGFVYEFMSNDTLSKHIQKVDKPFCLITLVRLFQVLEYLHSKSLIHRDLKPLNVLLDNDFLPYITDFETIRKDDSSEVTLDVGTPMYSSPEQKDNSNVHCETDIYSFGLILYFLFEKADLKNEFKSLSNASKNLEDLCKKCIDSKPENRPKYDEIRDCLYSEVVELLNEKIEFNNKPELIQLLLECLIMVSKDNDKVDQFLQVLTNKRSLLQKDLVFEDNFTVCQNNSDALIFFGNLYENGYGVQQNYSKALEYYKSSSKLNNSTALLFIGSLFCYGKGVEKNFKKAIEYFELSASKNNLIAILLLGNLYFYGCYVEQDYCKAKNYYEKLAKYQDNPFVNLQLGIMYENGYGLCQQNYAKAKEYYEKSAAKNNSEALLKLGNLYFNGYGVEQDVFVAVKYYELSMQLNNSKATLIMSDLYFNGYVIEKDYSKAKELYEVLVNEKIPIGYFKLGYLYENGFGVETDISKAKNYYELASQNKCSLANLFLGNLYFNGLGVEKDFMQAKIYYWLAIAKTLDDSNSLENFSSFYNNFNEVKQYFVEMQTFYELSVCLDDYSSGSILGTIYYNLFGFNEDSSNAAKYFKLLADKEDQQAILKLACFYEKGFGVKQSYAKAVELCRKLAKLKNKTALLKLAYFYENGFGVKQNYAKARKLYERLAKRKNQQAILNLGEMYEKGLGVKNDIVKAKEYYERLARLNNSEGLYRLGNIYYEGNTGIQKCVMKGKYYLELAVLKNNPSALCKLAEIWFDNGFDEVDEKEIFNKEFEIDNEGEDSITEDEEEEYNDTKEVFDNNDNTEEENNNSEENNNNEENEEEDEENDDDDELKRLNIGIKYLLSAAQLNNSRAISYLAELYCDGSPLTPQNTLLYIKYLEAAAKGGDIDILNALGDEYYESEQIKKDYIKALKCYEPGAKKGNLDSLKRIGDIYLFGGFGIKKSFSKAEKYYKLAGDKGDSYSYRNLGDLYKSKKNYTKAIQYYKLAAEKFQHSYLYGRIGDMYFDGNGVEQNYLEALNYYKLAVEKGHPQFLFKIGQIYSQGLGVEQDFDSAILAYETGARNKVENCIFELAIIYSNGIGVKLDYTKAINYYEHLCYLNNPAGFYNLGVFYNNGQGVEKDLLKAQEYYEIACEKNYLDAYIALGKLFIQKKDFISATIIFNKAAKLNVAEAFTWLGFFYENGYGTVKDYYKAREYYEEASNLNDKDGPLLIGHLYFYGLGFEKDIMEAKKYFEISANANDEYGFVNIGYLYQEGYLKDENFSNAKEYYIKAAVLKKKYGYSCLANLYLRYLEQTKKNHLEALQYYEKAAKLDDIDAFYHLGSLYSNDDLIDPDISKSIEYLEEYIKRTEVEDSFSMNYNNSLLIIDKLDRFRYVALNDLSLVYFIDKNEFEKGKEKIIESAKDNAYSYSINNLGLLNQFYLNNTNKAELLYSDSSKKKFALAFYNIGFLKEKKGAIDKSINNYIKASENEDLPLYFRTNNKYSDKRFEISKTFVICFANLKICHYFFTRENYEEAEKYFCKTFSKLNLNTDEHKYKFRFHYRRGESETEAFNYLKKFILGFPLFNILNQPNLNLDLDLKIDEVNAKEEKDQVEEEEDDNEYKKNEENNNDNDNMQLKIQLISKLKCNKKSNVSDDDSSSGDNDDSDESNMNDIDNDVFFDKPDDLFDFIVKNDRLKSVFLKQIREIIDIMNTILYTPPYAILFGRIWIAKPKINENANKKDINEIFMEGFGE